MKIWNLCRLAALVMALGGCSMLVMRGADPQQAHEHEPDCSETMAPIFLDGAIASATATALGEVARQDEVPLDGTVVAAVVGISLLFTISAAVGGSRYTSCRAARASWYADEAIRKAGASTEPSPQAAALARRGYFCTQASPLSARDLCVRDRDVCERARKALRIPEERPCVPREVLWCFGGSGNLRCFGTRQACGSALAATPSASGPCVEHP